MDESFPLEIDVQTVKSLRDAGESFLLLDVREDFEYEAAKIAGSRLIPMGQLRERLDELETHKNQRIVVQCHHGVRSLQVAHGLRSVGFEKAQSMAGGIEAWSLEIDPDVPRY